MRIRHTLMLAGLLATGSVAVPAIDAEAADPVSPLFKQGHLEPRDEAVFHSKARRDVSTSLSRTDLGLKAAASDRRLAAAAIRRHGKALGLRRTADVEFAGRLRRTKGSPRALAFEQRVGRLPVQWSGLTVFVRAGQVTRITGSVVPVAASTKLARKRIGMARAKRIALARIAGKGEIAGAPYLAVSAGKPGPGAPRPGRAAYVVQVEPTDAGEHESHGMLCVIVDAASGDVLTEWVGTAQRHGGADAEDPEALGEPAAQPPVATAAGTQVGNRIIDDLVSVWNAGFSSDPKARGVKHWDWELSRPIEPFTVGDYIFPAQGDYKTYWSGSYANDSQIDDGIAGTSMLFHDWLCKSNAWCGQKGGQDGDHYTYHVVGNWKPDDANVAGRFRYANRTVYVAPQSDFGVLQELVGHEMTHARYYSAIGDTIQGARYAAVNEGMADVGAFLYQNRGKQDPTDVLIGGLNLRSSTPAAQYAGSLSKYYCGTADGGGVHFNSTIISRAFTLYADATHTETARGIWNVMLFDQRYLTTTTDVVGFRTAFRNAVKDSQPSTLTQADQALAAVGLTSTAKIPC